MICYACFSFQHCLHILYTIADYCKGKYNNTKDTLYKIESIAATKLVTKYHLMHFKCNIAFRNAATYTRSIHIKIVLERVTARYMGLCYVTDSGCEYTPNLRKYTNSIRLINALPNNVKTSKNKYKVV